VAAKAREGIDYDKERVIALWKITTEQDWQLCETNQAGIQSTRYQPGPLSALTESGIQTLCEWYLRQLSRKGTPMGPNGR
jgi:Rieske 2Fe-2S family protein